MATITLGVAPRMLGAIGLWLVSAIACCGSRLRSCSDSRSWRSLACARAPALTREETLRGPPPGGSCPCVCQALHQRPTRAVDAVAGSNPAPAPSGVLPIQTIFELCKRRFHPDLVRTECCSMGMPVARRRSRPGNRTATFANPRHRGTVSPAGLRQKNRAALWHRFPFWLMPGAATVIPIGERRSTRGLVCHERSFGEMPVALDEPVDEGAETARDVSVWRIDDVQKVRPRREPRLYRHQLAARNGRLGQEGEGLDDAEAGETRRKVSVALVDADSVARMELDRLAPVLEAHRKNAVRAVFAPDGTSLHRQPRSGVSAPVDRVHLPGDEAWLVAERRSSAEIKYYLTNHPPNATLRALAGSEDGHPPLTLPAIRRRAALRARVTVERSLAHVTARTGAQGSILRRSRESLRPPSRQRQRGFTGRMCSNRECD